MSDLNALEQSPSAVPSKRWSKKKTAALIVGAVLVAGSFAGGLFIGIDSVDPRESAEYQSLSDSNEVLQGERDDVQSELDDLEGGIATRESVVEERTTQLDERSTGLDEREEELGSQDKEITAREKAVGKIEVEQAENSVENGVWTVGTDIKAGTYRTKEPVGSDCYWAVLKTGTNGSDIVNNGIPGGGRPTVSVKKGQDFESTRCGTWVKQ